MEPQHLRQDLKQETILSLLEQPDQRIIELRKRNELVFFAVRVIINLICSNRSSFYKTYRQKTTPNIPEVQYHELNGRAVREELEERALGKIDSLYWFDREVVRLYLKLGTYQAIENETRIPKVSCCRTVVKAVKQIRSEIGL